MERFENLLDFINELNENGRIPYDDYSLSLIHISEPTRH